MADRRERQKEDTGEGEYREKQDGKTRGERHHEGDREGGGGGGHWAELKAHAGRRELGK